MTNRPRNMNHDIRRQDRVMDEQAMYCLLNDGEYGFLALQAEEGGGYGIPVNYVWDDTAGCLYIHCAPQGRKLRCLAAEPRCTFCVVGRTNPLPAQFTTEYESVQLHGTARIGLPDEERMHALHLIVAKYCRGLEATGAKFAQGSFHRTEIIRLDPAGISGKAKVR